MSDPYSVLGVSPQASDDEVKKVYRELARKYHPDNYHDNPLADLAQEKMKDINEAYDEIVKIRSGGGGRASGPGAGYQPGYSGAATGVYGQIRQLINTGNLAEAERRLNVEVHRGAEWHFLMGCVFYRRGWLDQAREYYQKAVNMEPGNTEYRQALQYMSMGGNAYRNPGGGGGGSGLDACDCCTAMMCADCLCGFCR